MYKVGQGCSTCVCTSKLYIHLCTCTCTFFTGMVEWIGFSLGMGVKMELSSCTSVLPVP